MIWRRMLQSESWQHDQWQACPALIELLKKGVRPHQSTHKGETPAGKVYDTPVHRKAIPLPSNGKSLLCKRKFFIVAVLQSANERPPTHTKDECNIAWDTVNFFMDEA
jgi:hypothetical protein